jgi:hypothetical protein
LDLTDSEPAQDKTMATTDDATTVTDQNIDDKHINIDKELTKDTPVAIPGDATSDPEAPVGDSQIQSMRTK